MISHYFQGKCTLTFLGLLIASSLLHAQTTKPAQRLSKEFIRCEKLSADKAPAGAEGGRACVADEIERIERALQKDYGALVQRNDPQLVQAFRSEWQGFRKRYCENQPAYTGTYSATPAMTCELRLLLLEWAEMHASFIVPDRRRRGEMQLLLDWGRLP